MKVMITGSTSPISVACMWYEKHIGEVFEVEDDPKYDMYKTVNPIYKEHRGHIYKSDCILVVDTLPKAPESNEQPSEAVAEEEVYGNDCRNGQC